ncbi:hypothetical protein J3R30DRAFT_235446 [Lentinula aciculospora]|uniref:Uncharacterized protein n=1 Tax=Lentinula aciculospora TaxID=153920 RepID=A0A9W9AAL8_9AGAR|nr:hypothetical protein J3R30DRAFT_235446 [Lentinula aciculospora]
MVSGTSSCFLGLLDLEHAWTDLEPIYYVTNHQRSKLNGNFFQSSILSTGVSMSGYCHCRCSAWHSDDSKTLCTMHKSVFRVRALYSWTFLMLRYVLGNFLSLSMSCARDYGQVVERDSYPCASANAQNIFYSKPIDLREQRVKFETPARPRPTQSDCILDTLDIRDWELRSGMRDIFSAAYHTDPLAETVARAVLS